jgi:hypothetical protein
MAMVPSSGGIDFGLPRMAAAGALPQQQAQPQGGGGGGGLFPPGLMAAIQQYHDLSTKADDGSLAGSWRARGYAKQRDNLLAGATNAFTAETGAITAGAHVTGAQAQMLRAQNEPWLDAQKNAVTMYGHDITGRGQTLNYDLGRRQDTTHRYGIDTTADVTRERTATEADVQRRGQDFTLAPHLPQMGWDARAQKAWDANDPETAKQLATMSRFAPPARVPTTHEDMSGNTIIIGADGKTQVLSPAMKAQLAAERQAAPIQKSVAAQIKAEEEARKKAAGQ